MNDEQRAERAWLAYRDQYQREHPWADSKRVARQLRKRDFIAGYLAARTEQARPERGSAREQLLDALADSMNAGAPRPEHVVKAEALRESAAQIARIGRQDWESHLRCAAWSKWLRDRADALEVQP